MEIWKILRVIILIEIHLYKQMHLYGLFRFDKIIITECLFIELWNVLVINISYQCILIVDLVLNYNMNVHIGKHMKILGLQILNISI